MNEPRANLHQRLRRPAPLNFADMAYMRTPSRESYPHTSNTIQHA